MLLVAYTYPFLSGAETAYGVVYLCSMGHSWNFSVRVSNIPILSPVYSANQKRSCASIRPRRGDDRGVGTCQNFASPVLASMPMMYEPPISGAYGLPLEVTTVRSTYGRCGPGGMLGDVSQPYVASTFMVFGSIRVQPAQILPLGPSAMNCVPAPSMVLTSSVFGLYFVTTIPALAIRRGNQMLSSR